MLTLTQVVVRVLEAQEEEVLVVALEVQVQLITQQVHLMDNLELLILAVEVEPEDHVVVLVLEQEVVVQEQLSLDSQDLLDQEYL